MSATKNKGIVRKIETIHTIPMNTFINEFVRLAIDIGLVTAMYLSLVITIKVPIDAFTVMELTQYII